MIQALKRNPCTYANPINCFIVLKPFHVVDVISVFYLGCLFNDTSRSDYIALNSKINERIWTEPERRGSDLFELSAGYLPGRTGEKYEGSQPACSMF